MGCIQENKDRNTVEQLESFVEAAADGLHPGEQGSKHWKSQPAHSSTRKPMGCIQENKDRNHALGRRRPFAARADGLHPGEQGSKLYGGVGTAMEHNMPMGCIQENKGARPAAPAAATLYTDLTNLELATDTGALAVNRTATAKATNRYARILHLMQLSTG